MTLFNFCANIALKDASLLRRMLCRAWCYQEYEDMFLGYEVYTVPLRTLVYIIFSPLIKLTAISSITKILPKRLFIEVSPLEKSLSLVSQ